MSKSHNHHRNIGVPPQDATGDLNPESFNCEPKTTHKLSTTISFSLKGEPCLIPLSNGFRISQAHP
eukprot:c33514_g1_i1 orf=207-404(+)